jgi:hypothetical protein
MMHTTLQGLELIPSENFVSSSVMEAVGSIKTCVLSKLKTCFSTLNPHCRRAWSSFRVRTLCPAA